MLVGSLFSGIGGMDLGLERAGFTIAWQVEIDPFARSVLAKHWPEVPRYEDVREVGRHNLSPVDLVAGGFPCQPFSVAGKRRGEDDPRNLWPEMRRIVEGVGPRWVLAENVTGIINTYLDTVADGLEALGYTVGAFTLPAAAFGAPHLRERLFVVAYRDGAGQYRQSIPVLPQGKRQPGRDVDIGRGSKNVPDAESIGCPRWEDLSPATVQEWLARIERDNPWAVEPGLGRVVYGVANQVDRVKALGNAVVPQVVEFIGRLIIIADRAARERQQREAEGKGA